MRSWVVLFALAPLLAQADVFNTFGYGPRATAMGGAMTAEANDYTAVFYNPALLVDRKDVNFGFNFQFYRMVADVKSKDLAKPLDLSNSNAPDSVGTSVGLLFPLGGKVKNHLALGLGVYLPTANLLRVNIVGSNQPYWYRYHASPERLILHLGAGIKIVDWLKVGLGVQALADLIGNGANVSVDLFSKQVNSGDLNAYLATRVAPVFSLAVTPHKRIRLGVTFKWEMKLKVVIPAKVDLEGIGTLGFTVSGVAHFTPHTLNFGAAFDATENLTFTLDGEWQNWSAAPSPYVGINIDLSGPTLEALGLGSALDVTSAEQKPGFTDTFGVRAGAEYRVSERFAARAGAFLRPTPVPKQDTQGTNLLDGTAIGITGGIGFNFSDPLEIFQHPVQIDVAGQAQFLLSREANKAAVDSQPGYTYSANVYGVTAAIRYDF
ncbi:MAG: outer membrane protein transport protein [Archangium sp.]|nr:outer membrane protein transport protein [Archangium sp.]